VAYFLDSVHEVTGINLELLGMANREQAGVLENTRKQAGVTIIAPLFDGLRRYRKEQGRVLLYFIQTYLSDERLIRVNGKNPATGKEGQYYTKLSKAPETAKYDVIVDEAPTSPNMKERTFAVLGELVPQLMKAGIPVPPSILKYAPLPSSLTQEWMQHIEDSAGAPDPEQVQKMQEQMQKLQEENQQLKLKKEEHMAELQMDQAKAAQEMQIEQQKMQLEREKMAVEIEIARVKLRLEQEKAAADMQMAQQRNASEMQMMHQKASADRAMNEQKIAMQSRKTDADIQAKQQKVSSDGQQ
jgi:hypothetical protein